MSRCPETHPFAYNEGTKCCEKARGEHFSVMVDWISRKQAWESWDCDGTWEYCQGTADLDPDLTRPCENFGEPGRAVKGKGSLNIVLEPL